MDLGLKLEQENLNFHFENFTGISGDWDTAYRPADPCLNLSQIRDHIKEKIYKYNQTKKVLSFQTKGRYQPDSEKLKNYQDFQVTFCLLRIQYPVRHCFYGSLWQMKVPIQWKAVFNKLSYNRHPFTNLEIKF